MSSLTLHHALLRPAVLQILRAVGYHAAAPSVVDTLTDVTAKYIMLLASRAVDRAVENHNDIMPDITDFRLAMNDCGLLAPTATTIEEVWKELLRKPLSDVPERNGLRDLETTRRNEEDTAEVRDFIAWFQGPVYKEIRRISGAKMENAGEGQNSTEVEDYLTALKHKHSKTGEESRFKGTVLGIGNEPKVVKIDGGPESMKDWLKMMKGRGTTTEAQTMTQESSDVVMTD
ncbi:bromodomain-containing protein [Microthyrium microscopicum]|uniref:Bromodomain-containing protein n=1 Tax=Microthyrium microscopicum TaxID=703497 RepID=A0A6A6UTM8_9PEZI|nr:bromodomain-containing protein [Microthyrium microscopicum]